MKSRWLLVGPSLTLTGLAATALGIRTKQMQNYSAAAVFKMLCQIVLLGGVGAVVSFVLDQLNREREPRDAIFLLRTTHPDEPSDVSSAAELIQSDQTVAIAFPAPAKRSEQCI
jgi:hypothetical protein